VNRYDRARDRVPASFHQLLEASAYRVCNNARHGFHPPVTLDGVIEGRPLRVLLGVTESTLHVSVVLPALEGDDGEHWLSVAEVLHLRGPVLATSPWASWVAPAPDAVAAAQGRRRRAAEAMQDAVDADIGDYPASARILAAAREVELADAELQRLIDGKP
jgi:hypothetical protein